MGVDDSQAVLIRKGARARKGSVTMAAAASSLSLATLGMGAGGVFEGVRGQPKTARELAGWHENPYEFLTDGARAVRAFCRPWPWKVVGRSLDVKFDIGKAEFRLVVSAKAEDGVGEELGTEIYVPLVHYAHERWLGGGRRRRRSDDSQSVESVSDDGHHGNGVANGGIILAESRGSSTVTLEMQQSFSSSSTATTAIVGGGPELDLRRTLGGKELPLVEVDVRVSEGRWAVEGQMLRWWYDVPLEGEGEREYTIEIRRRGGVIKVREFEGEGLCDQLCPPCPPLSVGGCCVM